MKNFPFLLLLLIGTLNVYSQPSFQIHFKKNAFDLDPFAKQQIDSIKRIISLDHSFSISMTGRADSDGDSLSNEALSQKRVNSVLEYLGNDFLVKVNKQVLGESNPLVPNTNERNMQENRSVMVNLENSHNDFNTPTGTRRIIDELFGPSTSTYEFNAKEDITIRTKNGSYLKIPSYAFQDKAGRIIDGKVKLDLREFLEYPEMIFSGVSMNSNDEVLQSDGFFKMDANKKDQNLQLREGKSIELIFNNTNADSNMSYFRGVQNKLGLVNWIMENNNLNKIKVRKLEFNSSLLYSDNLLKSQKDSVDEFIKLVKLQENEDLAAKVIINAFKQLDAFKLNRLISLLELKNIWFGIYNPIGSLPAVANVYLYKSETQRELNFKDEVFSSIDFSKVNVISFETKGWKSDNYLIDESVVNEIVSIGQYVIRTSRLNYINCDRFANLKNPVQLAVKTDNIPVSSAIVLVFKNSKSVLNGNLSSSEIVFSRIPPNESALILAYSIYNGEFSYSVTPVVTGRNLNESITLTKASLEEFQDVIKKIN